MILKVIIPSYPSPSLFPGPHVFPGGRVLVANAQGAIQPEPQQEGEVS